MSNFCPATVPPVIRGADSDLPDEVTVFVNKTTQLECHADGNPAPKITWFKDSQPVSSDGPHRILSNGRTLQVRTRKHRQFALNHGYTIGSRYTTQCREFYRCLIYGYGLSKNSFCLQGIIY